MLQDNPNPQQTPPANPPTTPPVGQPSNTPPVQPAANQAPTPAGSKPGFEWTPERKEIVTWSVIANIVVAYINAIGGYIVARFIVKDIYDALGVFGELAELAEASAPGPRFDLIHPLTSGLFGGAVTAVIMLFFFKKIYTWAQKQFFVNWVNSFFKILFYPTVFGALVLLVVGSFVSLKSTVIIAAFTVAAQYVFAKILDGKIGKYFN